MAEKLTGNVKAHGAYFNKAGERVVATTTALGVLNKPALVPWANRLGLQGIDSTKYVDEKAAIGTLAHDIIADFLRGKLAADTFTPAEFRDYTPNQLELAHNSVAKFKSWYESNEVEPLLVEERLVSEDFQYGGTIDLFCKLNGDYALVDFKTGKAVYSEMYYQLAAYERLLVEHGHPVDNCRILRIGRDEEEGFEVGAVKTDLSVQWTIFWYCLELYRLKKIKA